jgi:hypothetical protein
MKLIYEVASLSLTAIYAPILFWTIRSIEQIKAKLNEHLCEVGMKERKRK